MRVEKLTTTIGAIVHGVDLRAVVSDQSLFNDIHELWMDNLVLFFRDQRFSPEQQLAIGETFGELHIHPAAPYVSGNPALMEIHTDANSSRNNGAVWHSDVSADETPPMASLLRIHRIPARGGDTIWANMYEVFASFSKPMQEFLKGLHAVHTANYSGFYGDHLPQRESPSAVHPVVRTHPVTGRQGLFVNRGFTKQICELEDQESRSLLSLLYKRVEDSVYHCRFQWQENSVALWDNRCTQHLALWDYFPESRSGTRVTIAGDKPFLEL